MYLVLVLYNKTTYLKTKNLTGFRKVLYLLHYIQVII